MTITSKLLGALALGTTLMSVGGAYAANPEFCHDYTETALHQSQEARELHCRRAIEEDPARWSFDRRGHFDWCVSVPREAAEREREARHEILEECRHR
jgi:hypothetical protein